MLDQSLINVGSVGITKKSQEAKGSSRPRHWSNRHTGKLQGAVFAEVGSGSRLGDDDIRSGASARFIRICVFLSADMFKNESMII